VGKIIGISIAALQRLVSLGGVPTVSVGPLRRRQLTSQAALPGVLVTLNSVAGQAVDIQLKILQVLLSILTHNVDVHDDVLGSVSRRTRSRWGRVGDCQSYRSHSGPAAVLQAARHPRLRRIVHSRRNAPPSRHARL